MTRFYLIGFFVLMCFDTMAQVGFKLAANGSLGDFPKSFSAQHVGSWIWNVIGSQHWIYFSVCGYLGAFITWMTLLKHAPIGPAFAASHLYIVTVMLISVAFFQEKLSTLQVVGCLFIMGGIFVLAAETGPDSRKEPFDDGLEMPPNN
jgi:drug/metabolite transporter (DMT)-like permease